MARDPELFHVVREPREGGTAPHPVIVLLHGRGADENDLLPLLDELDPTFFAISVRAPLRFGPGYAWYPVGEGPAKRQALAVSLDKLARLLDDLPRRFPVDPARLFTLGFSQGAVLAGSLLVKHPTVPAGTVILSGYLPLADLEPIDRPALAGRKVFLAHGTHDPTVPFALGEEARDFFRAVGADLTWQEYPIGHGIVAPELTAIDEWLGRQLNERAG